MIGLAVGGTLVPFTLFAWAQARISPEIAGAFLNLEPLVGVVLGVAAFGDPLGAAQLTGAAAILAGIVLNARALHTPAQHTPAPPATAAPSARRCRGPAASPDTPTHDSEASHEPTPGAPRHRPAPTDRHASTSGTTRHRSPHRHGHPLSQPQAIAPAPCAGDAWSEGARVAWIGFAAHADVGRIAGADAGAQRRARIASARRGAASAAWRRNREGSVSSSSSQQRLAVRPGDQVHPRVEQPLGAAGHGRQRARSRPPARRPSASRGLISSVVVANAGAAGPGR